MATSFLYTTGDAIRAAVGITSKEISDTMLTDQQLSVQMKTALYKWLPTYATIYTTGTTGSPTDGEIYQKDLVAMWCLYFGAVRVIEMIMALRVRVGDGKSEVQRFEVDWAELLETFKAKLAEIQGDLELVVSPTMSETTLFGRATPDYDPVADNEVT